MVILKPMGLKVRCKKFNGKDYLSVRDLAEIRVREGKKIKNIGRNFCRNESNFRMILAIEKSINPKFKEVDMNDLTEGKKLYEIASPTKLVEKLGLTCIVVERGKHGDVWMYHTLAVAFAMWMNAEFGAYVLTDYEKIKHKKPEAPKAPASRSMDEEDWKVIRYRAGVICDAFIDMIRGSMLTGRD